MHHDIFCHDTNTLYWTSYRDIYDTFTYASTNMGKHCLQLVLTLFPLFSPYARWFSEQTYERNPCWPVFSVIFKMADTTNACVLPTRLVSCTDDSHEQDTRRCCYVMLLCNVLYRALCCDNCIGVNIFILIPPTCPKQIVWIALGELIVSPTLIQARDHLPISPYCTTHSWS